MNRPCLCALVPTLLVLGIGLTPAQEIDPGGTITADPGPSLLTSLTSIPQARLTNFHASRVDDLPEASRLAPPSRPSTSAVPAVCQAAQCGPGLMPTRTSRPADAGNRASDRWVDLGHWTWIRSTPHPVPSGEVYFAPSSVNSETFPDGHLIRDVTIRISPHLDLHHRGYIDRSGIGFDGHSHWRLAIACTTGRWSRVWQRPHSLRGVRHDRGPVQGPWEIAPGSVASTLEKRLCR